MKKILMVASLLVSVHGLSPVCADIAEADWRMDSAFDGAKKPSRKAAPVHLSVAGWGVSQSPALYGQVVGDIHARVSGDWSFTGKRVSPSVRLKGLELLFHMGDEPFFLYKPGHVGKSLWTTSLIQPGTRFDLMSFKLKPGLGRSVGYGFHTAGRRGLSNGMLVSGKLYAYVGRRLVKFALPVTRLLIPLR